MAIHSTSDSERQHTLAPLAAGLYLVPTPIGNLRDMTLRALDVLAGADRILCEDTRVTGGLLHKFGIKTPMSVFTDNHPVEPPLADLRAGKSIALVSDAGTPLVSDPGARLVRAALEAGVAVTPLPGANAVLPALQLSALPTDRFLFAGFLPHKRAGRHKAMAELRTVPATLVFYEAPTRVADFLEDAFSVFGARAAVLCRELTKMHEQALRFTLGAAPDLANVRGECVVVIAPPQEGEGAEAFDLDALLRAEMGDCSLSVAVARVTARTGLPRKQVYARALELQE